MAVMTSSQMVVLPLQPRHHAHRLKTGSHSIRIHKTFLHHFEDAWDSICAVSVFHDAVPAHLKALIIGHTFTANLERFCMLKTWQEGYTLCAANHKVQQECLNAKWLDMDMSYDEVYFEYCLSQQ